MSLKMPLKLPLGLSLGLPARLPFGFSPLRLFYQMLTLLVFAAVTHICIVMLMPYLSYGNAWNRLEQFVPIARLVPLSTSDSGPPPLPFMSPDVRYAACRYDLASGPLELHTSLPNELWSITLYNQYGENYYLLSGQDVQGRAVNLLLVMDHTIDAADKDNLDDLNAATREVHEVTVSAPSETGIILIRAPIPSDAYREEIEQELKKAYCNPIDFARVEKPKAPVEPAVEDEAASKPPAVKKRRNRRR